MCIYVFVLIFYFYVFPGFYDVYRLDFVIPYDMMDGNINNTNNINRTNKYCLFSLYYVE